MRVHLGATEGFDAIVLDRMLPGLEGLDVLRRLRAGAVRVPVLVLTAKGGIADRVAGLDAGADDYLVKPFALTELAARLNALLRRPPISDVVTRLEVGRHRARHVAARGDARRARASRCNRANSPCSRC